MIKIKMKRYNRIVELKLPTEHEHVMVSLWKLGLERDPAKYTLRELNAVISYNTGSQSDSKAPDMTAPPKTEPAKPQTPPTEPPATQPPSVRPVKPDHKPTDPPEKETEPPVTEPPEEETQPPRNPAAGNGSPCHGDHL